MKADDQQSKYWNPYLETLEGNHLQELTFKRFKEIACFAFDHSAMYRELYKNNGVNPHTLNQFGDIDQIPITSKSMLQQSDDQSHFLYGQSLAVPSDEVVYFHQTSGTTSRPVLQPDTLEDWIWWAECWATVLWAQGVRPKSRVLFPFNYNLFIAFWGAHNACEKIGAEIVSTGALSTQERIAKIFELQIDTVITTPTYAFRMLETAEAENIDLSNSRVERLICAGEPGALVPSVGDKLKKGWGCQVYDHVGATEVGAWGFQCRESPDGLHTNDSMFLVELLELDSDRRIVTPNCVGRLVITSFYRKARPCIRFDTRDLACWAEDPCPCGRSFPLIKGGVIGRADHLLKVKGTLVTPMAVEAVVRNHEALGNEFKVIIGETGNHSLVLEVEVAPALNSNYDRNSLIADLVNQLRHKTSLSFAIRLLEPQTLSRETVKSKRIIDLRQN